MSTMLELIKQALSSQTVVGHWSQNHETRVDCRQGSKSNISNIVSKEAQHKVLETNNILQQGPKN